MRGLLQLALHPEHEAPHSTTGALDAAPAVQWRRLGPHATQPIPGAMRVPLHMRHATAFDCCEHWVYSKNGKIHELADIDGFSQDCPLDWSEATGKCRGKRENMDFIGTIRCMSLSERDNCKGYLMHWLRRNTDEDGKIGREKLINVHKHLQCGAKGSTGKAETVCKVVDGDAPEGGSLSGSIDRSGLT
mmetsp:Transcript_10392/g.23504  ORF Transcript_10392/g.23504 Transcript_10392/m.23504 type:complete len:189 (-) Transcript_10392:153-719(-)